MKAIAQDRYGPPDVLELREIEQPAVDADGILVRVRAASVNPYDWHVMRGAPFIVRFESGLRRPKQRVRGVDVAGIVEAVGENVTDFQPGDEVFGAKGGALAEYVCAGAKNFLVPKPASLTFEQAASVGIAATTALQALRDKGRIEPGQRALIHGAGGGVGTYAVQIAKSFGAHVTGVTSTGNLDLVRSIGADEVVDYTAEDFTRRGQRYDLILSLAGTGSLSGFRRALTPKGTLVLVAGPLRLLFGVPIVSRFVSQSLRSCLAKHNKADLLVLTELIEAGKVTPVIDRTYPLSETADAIRYLETGHARGKVVITV